jgi:hypothetical protein
VIMMTKDKENIKKKELIKKLDKTLSISKEKLKELEE